MDEVAAINVIERPKLKDPILIESLPGIGLVGKIAGDHMRDELKMVKFAELYSPFLPPQVTIQPDGTVRLPSMEFSYLKGKKDIVLLTGDFQGITPESQYRLSEKTLEFAKDIGVKKVYTLGGLETGSITSKPKVYGAATSKKLIEEHKGSGIVFKEGGAIFGASGLLLGIGMGQGVEAVCLMGETHGQIIDAKSAEAVLKVLAKVLDIEIGMAALSEKSKETERQMNRIRKMIAEQTRFEKSEEKFMSETPTYIR